MAELPLAASRHAFRARRRPYWPGEVALVGAFYAAYAEIRDTHGRDTAGGAQERAAAGHARGILHVERLLHLDPERGLQSLLPRGGLPLHAINAFYLLAHVTVTVAVLVFLLVRRPAIYRRCRTALLGVSAAALAIFALYPTLPPRLLPAAHVRNALASGGLWSLNHGGIERIADPYAAMPSLHLGWSTWVALSLAAAIGHGRRRWLLALYPLFVSAVVLANGAHWLLDVVAGAALSLLCWWASGRLHRVAASGNPRGSVSSSRGR